MKFYISILLLMFTSKSFFAQNDSFSKEIFVSKTKDSLKYRLLTPDKVEKGKKYPLVLFLHGAGERGTDNESQLRNGGTLFSNPSNREKFPSFVLFPQCPPDFYWPIDKRPAEGFMDKNPFEKNAPISTQLKLVDELLTNFIKNNPIDENRIYIMGLSMGGMGTFDFVCRFPNRFAAAIPICGGVNTSWLKEFRGKTKFRIYHGDIDSVVSVEFSREAYKALKESGNDVEYIEFYGVGHNSWYPAFNMPDFLPWLYQIKK
ncbi:carboxylesterase family protein [Capnocytophaga cynodegmi]|uniref:carboxylesterase family protein n=1 Tax=Capnocytophaga cynodegmi TaxID=28189 RepID=UPI001EE2C5AA|nr:alpha/beta hydrolase-fold protein [Capnocytophaga cynodegmi]